VGRGRRESREGSNGKKRRRMRFVRISRCDGSDFGSIKRECGCGLFMYRSSAMNHGNVRGGRKAANPVHGLSRKEREMWDERWGVEKET